MTIFNIKKNTWRTVLSAGAYLSGTILLLFAGVFIAMQFGLTNVKGSIDILSGRFNTLKGVGARKAEAEQTVSDWVNTPDWTVISAGFTKDDALIKKASAATGVPERLIVSTIIVEQFRYFGSNREVFKKFFEPLQILGNATKFSYGVAGIKVATAQTVENNLKDPKSPYYLGPSYEHLLDFTTSDPDTERMNRLTDPNDHYYSYLYTALLLKEEETQWKNAGYPINDRPEILATLFNLGFDHSNPNADPQAGGATITVDGHDYTFGGLAFDFYYSNEMVKEFPE